MMKTFITVFLSLSLLISFAQPKVKKDRIGTLSVQLFQKNAELKTWFEKEYNAYKPNDSILKIIKPLLSDKKVVVVLGTWCSDSQREFPRLLKVLDGVGYSTDSLKIYGVDSAKAVPATIIKKYKITNVPTIIIFDSSGKEKGRIIESAKQTLELDLEAILK